MVEKFNRLLDQANQLAKEGITICDTRTEELIYMITFSSPNITVVEAAKHVEVAPSTARRALNSLVEKDLLFKDLFKKRNVEYFNYNVLELFDR